MSEITHKEWKALENLFMRGLTIDEPFNDIAIARTALAKIKPKERWTVEQRTDSWSRVEDDGGVTRAKFEHVSHARLFCDMMNEREDTA